MAWYRTGTISVTNGSVAVTGSGTSWLLNASAGEAMLMPDGKLYEIQSINSNTSITLATNYTGSTQSGQTYVVVPTQSYIRDLAAQAATLVNTYSTLANNAGAGKFSDGTAAAPGVTFVTDQDTGFFRSANNEVTFVANGVAQFKYSATGGITFLNNTVTINGTALVKTDDSRLTNSREWTAATVDQAEAEAGTGTTRRAWTAQRVRQAIAAWWNTITHIDGKVIGQTTPAAGSFTTLNANGNVTLGDAQTDTLNVGNGDIVKTSAGLVGIGTADPAQKMDVRTTTGAAVVAGRTANTGVGSEVGYFETRAPNAVGTARVWSQIKTVIGNATTGTEASSLVVLTQSAGAFAEAYRVDPSRYMLVGYATSNGAYRLQVNGQIFATSATIATSDARYKENVQDLTGALDIVSALRPVQFNWKPHPSHNFNTEIPTIGFLAQEVQQVLADKPYLNSLVKANLCEIESAQYEEVVVDPGSDAVVDEDGNVVEEAKPAVVQCNLVKPAVTEEFLGIAEGNMIAILTKAIQELKAEFDAYKANHP